MDERNITATTHTQSIKSQQSAHMHSIVHNANGDNPEILGEKQDNPSESTTHAQGHQNVSGMLSIPDEVHKKDLGNLERWREAKEPQDKRSVRTNQYVGDNNSSRVLLTITIELKHPRDRREKIKEPKELQHRNVDDDTGFWQTYVEEAGKYDKELIESWNDNLDSLLLFAALFSAINTAFIIESYKGLQPNATDSTNELLRLILAHRNDNEPIPEAQLGAGSWSASPGAIRVNSMLFASLSCSILASFGAILGKEMVAEYKTSGTLSTLPKQGRTRQKKYNGLRRYRFELLMQMLPILLQISLALFLIGIIDFLKQMCPEVAIVIMIPVAGGFIAYVASLVIAVWRKESPFQTSLSKSIRRRFPTFVLSFVKSGRRFITYLASQLSAARSYAQNLVQSITIIWTHLQKTHFWSFLSSKFSSTAQTFHNSTFNHIVGEVWRWIFISSYQGVSKIFKQLLERWKRLDTGIWLILYMCGLGVAGWVVESWAIKLLGPQLRSPGANKPQELDREMTRDDVSSDCVVWLLENSQDTKVIHKALETLPLLPADVLLQCFEKKPKILDRYILMYNSTLQRRPGDVEFRLDSAATKDAIAAGTALFHILKSRQVIDWNSHSAQRISFGADPELFDSVKDAEQLNKFDFSLLTVFLCMQTQNGVGEWDFNLLQKLLKRLLDTLGRKSSMFKPVNELEAAPLPDTFKPATPSITLLLDAGIFLVSQKYYYWQSYNTVNICSDELESILETVHSIMGKHPTSMTLSSHVALFIAMTQWFRRKDQVTSPAGDEELEFNGVKLSRLRKAWFAVDKRADFFENIVLAFNLVETSADSSSTTDIYVDLVMRTEDFLPKVMDVSQKHKEWSKWWSTVIQAIPGLLCLLRRVDLKKRPEVAHAISRIISRLLPDDWDTTAVKNALRKSENASLHAISLYHPEHGLDMAILISTVLSSYSTISSSPQTKWSVAEVLSWMIIHPNVTAKLPSLVESSGMYKQSTTIPAFLISVITDSTTSYNLTKLCERHYKRLLMMSPQGFPSASEVQLEALAVALANTKAYLKTNLTGAIFRVTYKLLDKMTLNEELESWPMSFKEHGVIHWEHHGEGLSRKEVLQLVHWGWHGSSHYGLTETVSGQALMLIWRKLSNQNIAADSLYMFREDVLWMVLECLDKAINLNCEVSCQTIADYLEKALTLGRVGDEMKERVNNAIADLKVANTDGWDTLVLKRIGEKKAENSQEIDLIVVEA